VKLLLFTGPQCPACRTLKGYLDLKDVQYDEVDVSDFETYIEVCTRIKFHPMSLPTLLWLNGDTVHAALIGWRGTRAVDEFLALGKEVHR